MLKADICRCHDAGCPEHGRCERYLQREMGTDWTVAAPTLYPYDQPLGGQCPHLIAKGSQGSPRAE